MMMVLMKKHYKFNLEGVTQVGNQLEQDKVVTGVSSGNLLISLVFALFDGALFNSMF